MPTTNITKKKPLTYLAAFALLAGPLAAKERVVESTKDEPVSKGAEADVRIHVPNRHLRRYSKANRAVRKRRFISIPTLTS